MWELIWQRPFCFLLPFRIFHKWVPFVSPKKSPLLVAFEKVPVIIYNIRVACSCISVTIPTLIFRMLLIRPGRFSVIDFCAICQMCA